MLLDSPILVGTAVTFLFLLLLRFFAADVYDVIIVYPLTTRWYAAVFEKLSEGDRVLDAGIGTATALVRNKDTLLKKRISVIGFDYEERYVTKAKQMLEAYELLRSVPEGTKGYRPGEYYCRVFHKSIYDPDLVELCEDGAAIEDKTAEIPQDRLFDAAYFSGSLTVMPDPVEALRAVVPLIKKDSGRIYITQTFEKKHSAFKAAIKPLMKYVTTIDFGQLTTESKMQNYISEAGVFDVVEDGPITGSVNTFGQTAKLIVLRIKADVDQRSIAKKAKQ
jgi:alpha-N-acetylglucosaminidase